MRRLHRIAALRDFRFALAEIGALLRAEPDQDPRDLVRQQPAVVDERIAKATALRDRLCTVLDGLDNAVQPSTTEFLRLIEETNTMHQPLTPAEFARLSRQRSEYTRRLTPAELAAMTRRRADAYAAMSPAERNRLRAERARMVPPDAATTDD